MSLKNIHIAVSPLTGEIYIARLDAKGTAKEKREAKDEVINALIQHIFHNEIPNVQGRQFEIGGVTYYMELKRFSPTLMETQVEKMKDLCRDNKPRKLFKTSDEQKAYNAALHDMRVILWPRDEEGD